MSSSLNGVRRDPILLSPVLLCSVSWSTRRPPHLYTVALWSRVIQRLCETTDSGCLKHYYHPFIIQIFLFDTESCWDCSLIVPELNFRFFLKDHDQKDTIRDISGKKCGDVVALGNIPCFPPLLLHVNSGIIPITPRELGRYETGNNAVFNQIIWIRRTWGKRVARKD